MVIGYRKFGAALIGLAHAHGVRCGAWDAERPVPDPVRVPLPACSTAAFVVLAVPVPAIRRAAQSVKPWLSQHTVVLDVGSAKAEPADVLRDAYVNHTHLGARAPSLALRVWRAASIGDAWYCPKHRRARY